MCFDISVASTISITIFRNVCLWKYQYENNYLHAFENAFYLITIRPKNINILTCLPVTFARISQSLFWRSLNATARWWFSNTLSSLYMSASSEPIVCIDNQYSTSHSFRQFYVNIFDLLILHRLLNQILTYLNLRGTDWSRPGGLHREWTMQI